MSGKSCVRGVALLVGILCSSAAVAIGKCTLDRPEDLVSCWGKAMRERDESTMNQLLAPDFVQQYLGEHTPSPNNREEWIEGTMEMVTSSKVRDLDCKMGGGFSTTSVGDGVWVLNGIDLIIRLEAQPAGKEGYREFRMEKVLTWYIRETSDPGAKFRIFKWEEREK